MQTAKVAFIESDFHISDLKNAFYESAENISIDCYWSGETALVGRHFSAKMLWSESALYVRFEANQTEPLVISETANRKSKTIGLWDRDVCEIFIAPKPKDFRRYFEFEIAPNGEWLDLGIHQMPDARETDWDYASEMQSAAQITDDKVIMAMKVEWTALGNMPLPGDKWLGNLFRCVGTGETRGYLAWSPTLTEVPSFHVPEKFGEFEFVK